MKTELNFAEAEVRSALMVMLSVLLWVEGTLNQIV